MPARREREWIPHGYQFDPHTHAYGQLVWVAAGLVATTTSRGTWLAPPNRVTWTPPGFVHGHRFYGDTDGRAIEILAEWCGDLPSSPSVFEVSPLLKEAMFALSGRPTFRPGAEKRLVAIAVDELAILTEAGDHLLHLPEPQDDRLRTVTDSLHADPAQATNLSQLGRAAGASERTLSRLFHDELGMSFHRWRTILRIHHALIFLTEGRTVTETAMLCGWSNPSGFIDAFTQVLGQTPGRYQASALYRA